MAKYIASVLDGRVQVVEALEGDETKQAAVFTLQRSLELQLQNVKAQLDGNVQALQHVTEELTIACLADRVA